MKRYNVLVKAEKYVETYSFTNTEENFKIKEVVNNN